MLWSVANLEARKESPSEDDNSVVTSTGTGRSSGGVYAERRPNSARDLRLFED